MCLRYSAGVVAPMHWISPRESAGFRMFAASSEPSAEPAPTSVCSSSMKIDDVRGLGELPHDRLEPLLELAAVLRAGDDQRDVEREDPLVREVDRHVALHDLVGEALDERRLADAGLADQHRVVAGAAAQHLDDPLELLVAPDQRVERVARRRLGQVARELREQRRLLRLARLRLLVEQREDVLAHRGEAHALLGEDPGGHAALLAHQPEQDVLGADVVVQHALGLLGRVAEHALALDRERDLDRGGDLLAVGRAALDLLADLLHGEVALAEQPRGEALPLADQAEQQVLGLDGRTAQLARLVAGEEDHPPSPLGVALEHSLFRPRQIPGRNSAPGVRMIA